MKENWTALQQAYQRNIQYQDPGLVQTFLAQSKKEPDLWRILTVWESQAALDSMRASGETPRGVLIFREASTEPSLSIFDIAQQMTAVRPG